MALVTCQRKGGKKVRKEKVPETENPIHVFCQSLFCFFLLRQFKKSSVEKYILS